MEGSTPKSRETLRANATTRDPERTRAAILRAATAEITAKGLTGDNLELVAGQATLSTMVLFPASLIVLFAILTLWVKKTKAGQKAETGAASRQYAHV